MSHQSVLPPQNLIVEPSQEVAAPPGIVEYKRCKDERGNHRALGDTWPDPRDPCTIWVCTLRGPVNMPLKQCDPPPPPPNSHCRVVVVDCCNTWECSTGRCTDESGHHELGDKWLDPTDPCTILTCTHSGIQKSNVRCPPIPPPPQEGCRMVKEQCCYVWRCSGCVDDNGVPHEEGSMWEDPRDPCTIHVCMNGRIQSFPKSVIEPCPRPGPKPHEGCVYALIDCCHQWNCTTSGCKDKYGKPRDIGEVWPDPTDSCYTFHCTPTGIERKRTFCPKISTPPHASCTLDLIGCCYNWTCPIRDVATIGHANLAQIPTALVVSAYNFKTSVTRIANVHLGTIVVLLLAVARNVYQKLNLAAAPRPILIPTLSVSALSTPVKETKTALEKGSAAILSVARNVWTLLFIEHVQQQYVNLVTQTLL
ncbi:hypothetical protein Pcinc_031103 [Petrolisthes cinctipes]|uniref:Uncharacterized protein n=1 Tax=Petrolisthes cinctipes TaxID=88211 RepID=A0AAE1EXW3_PETCI|nr:hypothetical protein Pcinc_031103 [Petrolisthes cinctipes]